MPLFTFFFEYTDFSYVNLTPSSISSSPLAQTLAMSAPGTHSSITLGSTPFTMSAPALCLFITLGFAKDVS